MEYRSYRDTDCRPSLLGLGCMRLPTLEPGGTAIDYARAGALVDEAVRGGITYFDVAYPYHGGGAEKFIGAALESALGHGSTASPAMSPSRFRVRPR